MKYRVLCCNRAECNFSWQNVCTFVVTWVWKSNVSFLIRSWKLAFSGQMSSGHEIVLFHTWTGHSVITVICRCKLVINIWGAQALCEGREVLEAHRSLSISFLAFYWSFLTYRPWSFCLAGQLSFTLPKAQLLVTSRLQDYEHCSLNSGQQVTTNELFTCSAYWLNMTFWQKCCINKPQFWEKYWEGSVAGWA